MSGFWATLEIENALDIAQDFLEGELGESERNQDLMGLFMATFKAALRQGDDIDLATIVRAEHGETYTADDVKSWWGNWS